MRKDEKDEKDEKAKRCSQIRNQGKKVFRSQWSIPFILSIFNLHKLLNSKLNTPSVLL